MIEKPQNDHLPLIEASRFVIVFPSISMFFPFAFLVRNIIELLREKNITELGKCGSNNN